MKNKRNKFSRKSKRGGFFFSNNSVASSSECDPNNLSSITDSTAMHANYQKCCPRGFFGKNSSPYCKQLDLNYKASVKGENDANAIAGDASLEQYNSFMGPEPKKPWYKFWGGKTKRRRISRRTRSRRRK